jgi:hypothetical protein
VIMFTFCHQFRLEAIYLPIATNSYSTTTKTFLW